jgi:hypothetical protein
MFTKAIAAAFALAASLGFAQTTSATEHVTAPATVVVYRAEESVTTKRLNVDVTANNYALGKLKKDGVVVSEGPAGEYTLGTSMPGTEPLTLDLKPGATYYVHTKLEMRGGRIYVSLTEVAEQVARVQNPTLDGAI